MSNLTFGQPDNGIIQLGYVVEDLQSAMRTWAELLRVGPWYTIESFAGIRPNYRGHPATALCDIALGFAGHMQIELIQPCDEKPSVYREMIDKTGYGFHHYGVAARDIEAESDALKLKGYDLAFTASVPTGGRVAYFDTHGDLPGMIELLEADDALDSMFSAIHRASIDWDGADQIRPMASLNPV